MPNPPIISISHLTKSFDDQVALDDINLDIQDGEFMTILGPSGCGKSTLLRIIAGFEVADSGRITLAGDDLAKISPEDRHVNMIFQNYALFPHMSVFENIAFGLRCEKKEKKLIHERVFQALQRVKLAQLSKRKPAQLSGGQQQRVALARAVVKEPLVLLLDEPLSALDYALRKTMQSELKALQRRLGITFVMVTHDQEEALSLSDRIVVMNDGVIEQIGTPRDVYEEPVNLYVADFIGQANIFNVEILNADEKQLTIEIGDCNMQLVNRKGFKQGDCVSVVVRPEDIQIWGRGEIKKDKNTLAGHVKEVIYKGSTVDLVVQLTDGQLIFASEFFDEDDEDLEYEEGEYVLVKWTAGWEVVLKNE